MNGRVDRRHPNPLHSCGRANGWMVNQIQLTATNKAFYEFRNRNYVVYGGCLPQHVSFCFALLMDSVVIIYLFSMFFCCSRCKFWYAHSWVQILFLSIFAFNMRWCSYVIQICGTGTLQRKNERKNTHTHTYSYLHRMICDQWEGTRIKTVK